MMIPKARLAVVMALAAFTCHGPAALAQQASPAAAQHQPMHRLPPQRLDPAHQPRFRQAIRGLGVAAAAANAFVPEFGRPVPRTVGLHPLPPSIIDAYPEFEGFQFVVEHGDIVVVDPATLMIVDVFPA